MAAISDPGLQDPLSALSWVQEELRRSLETAHKALRRYLKEQEQRSDLDTIDPNVLRQARSQIHQSVGVLELVGLGRAAELLRASEAALQRISTRPKLLTSAAVDAIEHGSFALLEFIDRSLAGKPVSTLALFPQYKALQELAGAQRVHPADLWSVEWSWREAVLDTQVAQRHPDEDTFNRIEADLLALMRGAPPSVAARMSELFAGLAAGAQAVAQGPAAAPGAPHSRLATLWQLAAGFFEAQADGLLQLDAYSKRLGSRLLSQLRAGEAAEPSERLAHDLLFFCAQAGLRDGQPAGPRLSVVRQGYQLADVAPVDYERARLGRFDPAWVAQARKRVAAAKEVWSAVAGGDLARIDGLSEQFVLVSDSLVRLYPDGALLGRSLQVAIGHTSALGTEPPAELAMEVATALLYIEASLDDGDFDQADGAHRIQRLAQRIDAVRQARDPGTLDLWMEELYRRVSDRQTMGSVVQELRSSLSEIEKNIDQYFRNPTQREVLIPVPGQLSAMRGVLSVLGLDQASQAVLRMRDDVDALASTEVNPQHAIQTGTFDRLADNLGALSFLIDMVSVQPQMAKSLFRFDPETGSLSAVMAREDRPTGFDELDTQATPDTDAPADTDALAVTLEFDRIVKQARATQRSAAAESGAGLPMLAGGADALATGAPSAPAAAPAWVASPAPAPAAPPPVAATVSSGLEDDPEMREIFLDEAREVLDNARQALSALQSRHDDREAFTTVRRAFHTLKGSARMVGLRPFGEAAWACEQLYNARLSEPGASADSELRDFSLEACRYFGQWVDAIEADDTSAFDPDRLVGPADALRTGARRSAAGDALRPADTVTLGQRSGADVLTLRVPGLPSAGDLDLGAAEDALPALDTLPGPDLAPTPPAGPVPTAPLPPLDFAADIDLDVPGAGAPGPTTVTVAPGHAGLTVGSTGAAAPAGPAAHDGDLPPLADAGHWPATPDAAPSALAPFDLALPDSPTPPAASAEEAIPVAETLSLDLGLDDLGLAELGFPTDAPAPAAEAPPSPAAPDDVGTVDLVLDQLDPMPPAAPPRLPDPTEVLAGPAPERLADLAPSAEPEAYRQIGPLRIGIPLFNIYLNEADELSRRLGTELAEWSLEQHRGVGEDAVALAHSLAGNSGAVGYTDLSQLARELEHALGRSQARGHGQGQEARVFTQAADEIRRLLHLFAAGFLNSPDPGLLKALRELSHGMPAAPAAPAAALIDDQPDAPTSIDHAAAVPAPVPAPAPVEPAAAAPVAVPTPEPMPAPAPGLPASPLGRSTVLPFVAQPQAVPALHRGADAGPAFDDDVDQQDAVDAELFPIFVEEAQELLLQLQTRLREWARRPDARDAASACMRSLHTFKGSARLAGAMRLGELAHRLETQVERLGADPERATPAAIDRLLSHADVLEAGFESLRKVPAAPAPAPVAAPVPPVPAAAAASVVAPASAPVAARAAAPARQAAARAAPADAPRIDWQRFDTTAPAADLGDRPVGVAAAGSVRVHAPLLDRLVNHAGEVSITRARIESDVGQLKGGLGDLSDNLERLRAQLRDIELQAETQIGTRLEAARAAMAEFDPLEMDRFTRFQELTRMMAESVADVATVQRGLQRTLQSTEDALAHQARMTRDMQDDLLRTRMVEFEGLSERLYRVVRQAAKETGKAVRLDIEGGGVEIDRGVLDRMLPAFEHLLRNCVVHGIEPPDRRAAAGKEPVGAITMAVTQVGNEVAVEVRDDGAGLDLAAIRARAVATDLLAADAQVDETTLANLIFQSGFSTAATITDLAGRGVGMDVVRTDVNAMGGRIETASAAGRGTSIRLVLPLTTAVTQVVMLRCGERAFAVPSTLVEVVRRMPVADLHQAYQSGRQGDGASAMPFFWFDSLLQGSALGQASGRTAAVVVMRSAAQRVMLHVDEVIGNQEVVVKNLGPQLSRVPGLVGMTLLPSGLPALIYNPVALATLYGDGARQATQLALAQAAAGPAGGASAAAVAAVQAPLVLVVDDSLTVRRITQRLLEREGYRVQVAKDGLDGLDKLGHEVPAVLLTDIEMPRMDGFDLVRTMRSDARLTQLPVVMITSRIAQKHRDYAAELGVDHYLGKPYVEEELLSLVARYARRPAAG